MNMIKILRSWIAKKKSRKWKRKKLKSHLKKVRKSKFSTFYFLFFVVTVYTDFGYATIDLVQFEPVHTELPEFEEEQIDSSALKSSLDDEPIDEAAAQEAIATGTINIKKTKSKEEVIEEV